MTINDPLDLDAIEARAAGLYEYATGLDAAWQDEADQLAGTDVPAMAEEIRRFRADAADALLPAWEAMYEPGNVSNYLIGYANDEAAAKGAAEAWLRSQAEVTGRLEWQPWGTVTNLPDGYDAWFELAECHDDGIDTGPGIVVRRRVAARSAVESHVVADDSDDPEPGTRSCGHDDYHDPHEWADRPGVWCPGISYADDQPAVRSAAV